MKLSPHFDASEFACHCGCGFGTRLGDVAGALVDLLEAIRAHFEAPVTVVSGCRCAAHNARVGGAKISQHRYGKAADIKVQGVPPRIVADFVSERYPKTFGVGRYGTWTHVDVRRAPARWGSN